MINKVLLLLLLNALGGSSPESAAAANPKPNILMIVVDDLGYADLSCLPHGATDVRTPSIDRLANRGIRFTAAYATAPICNAARIALMTGYDRKTVRLHTDQDATITLEVDVDGTGLWIPYRSIKVGATTLIDHTLPEGFSAYWVRAVSDTDTTASVVFTYH